jgi:hypothetical protein
MRASFTDTPDLTPYAAVTPKQALSDTNPRLSETSGPAREAAKDSLKMRFDVPDAAPTARLNRTVWGQIKGWEVPYPGVRSAVFSPLAVPDEDEEDEDEDEEDENVPSPR